MAPATLDTRMPTCCSGSLTGSPRSPETTKTPKFALLCSIFHRQTSTCACLQRESCCESCDMVLAGATSTPIRRGSLIRWKRLRCCRHMHGRVSLAELLFPRSNDYAVDLNSTLDVERQAEQNTPFQTPIRMLSTTYEPSAG